MAIYRYPLDIAKANSTYLTFTIARNRGFTTTELRNVNDNQFETITRDAIGLPLPNNFNELSAVNYTDIQDTSLVGQAVSGVVNRLDPAGALQQEAKIKSGTTKAIQQMSLFDGVPVKNWTFTWELIPESSQEMNNIEQIIQTFELSKLPTYTNSSEFLEFPNILTIDFGGVRPKLIRFLPCVITQTNVSYGNGDFNLYSDGGFPIINLTLELREIAGRARQTQERMYLT